MLSPKQKADKLPNIFTDRQKINSRFANSMTASLKAINSVVQKSKKMPSNVFLPKIAEERVNSRIEQSL